MDYLQVLDLSQDKLCSVSRDFDKQDNIYLHSVRVAQIIKELTKNEELEKVALLHDIIEDSDVTKEYLLENGLSKSTTALIEELTNNNTEVEAFGRTQYMIQKLLKLSDEAFLIKLVDRYDNLKGAFELTKLPEYQFLKKTIDMFISWYANETQCLMFTVINERVESIVYLLEENDISDYQENIYNATKIMYDKLFELVVNERY